MEWKKENTNSEELDRRQKEYIDAAIRMMKRAENMKNESCAAAEEKSAAEDISEAKEEIPEATYSAPEAIVSDKEEKCEEQEAVADSSEETTEAEEAAEEIIGYDEEAAETAEAVTEENEREISEEEDTEGDYGVYTAEEILSGEGFKNAEKIIDEIKQQKNAMKKMTEEQEAAEVHKTCPKCGKTIDGRT